MGNELLATSEPVIISSEVAEEVEKANETTESTEGTESGTADSTEKSESDTSAAPVVPEDILTNETYLNGVSYLVDTIDPLSVNEEVLYVDSPVMYAAGGIELPDYAVVYEVDGVEVVFPTSYADNILVVDGLLINLGDSYTAGAQITGYSVNNYLSSEITIPTYHSSTWYQYLQSYGQPYRIVDRYVNTSGYISSSTRSTVDLTWSGGNPWEGFTFDRIALFMIIGFLTFMLLFRKGR